MTTARDGDHAMGLELQIEELVEQRARATTQGRHDDGRALDREIAALQLELAAAVDPTDRTATAAVIRTTPAPGSSRS